ncbi:MAG: ferritin-like domain-containing protein [Deltaproteobacteria bacterium]|nr:ferritin-like domain-containing protein [Deltaproteobacteria bacterium]
MTASLVGPAVRGFVLQRGKASNTCVMEPGLRARFVWDYAREMPELATLYAAGKQSQWDGATALDWDTVVDPHDERHELILDDILPLKTLPGYRAMTKREQQLQRHALLAWILSQFLHGEQGALLAACQVTEAVGWTEAKLFGSTQVMDEGRHVEVFHRYLTEKLRKTYPVNDNLYVIMDALLGDARWDIKFLGMQILIEGLALGSFGTIRAFTREPLLQELLRRVITDEARHVHFGVLALRDWYGRVLSEKERREREDWAFEVVLLMRNRFLAHEYYEEHWAHAMRRSAWDRSVSDSDFMAFFRRTLLRRVIPNLKRIHLLSERIRPHYAREGMLAWENEKAAPDLTAQDMLESERVQA